MKKTVWITGIVVLALLIITGTAIAYFSEQRPPVLADKGEEEQPVEAEVKLFGGEGVFNGRIDSHSVEIEINGEIKVFGLSEAVRDTEFHRGDITFKYFVDKNGKPVIAEADFEVSQRGEVKNAEGIFSGLADSHTAEIIIDGEPFSFGLDQGISFDGIEEEDEIYIVYQENELGRLVIIKIEKII